MRKKGFTLIEMLIVIVIIGILAAAILPKILGARDRAEDIAIKADLKNIATALEMYYMDNGTYKIDGAGAYGLGLGSIHHQGGYYTKSILHALEEQGYLQGGIKAKGEKNNIGVREYRLYLCDNHSSYSLSARLYSPSNEDIEYIKTTCNGTGSNGTATRYGMNYAIAGGRG